MALLALRPLALLRQGVRFASSVSGIQTHGGFVRVKFANGDTSDYHSVWLRHKCVSSKHPKTGEYTLCSSRIPDDLQAVSAKVQPGGAAIAVQWSHPIDGVSESVFPADWLDQYAYARNRVVEEPVCDVASITIDAAQLPAGQPLWKECQERVHRDGAVIVRGGGDDTEVILSAFAAGGWKVVPTHFGRIEDLRTDNTTNKNTDQLGYTDAAVDLHTDQPFIAKPPRFQMLHCMRPAAQGGENMLADAGRVAQYLRAIDRSAYDLLTTRRIAFHRKQKQFTSLHVGPVLEVDKRGNFSAVRLSYFTMDPWSLPFDEMEDYYRAYNKFMRLLTKFQFRALLNAGDFLVYDNHRMLHARTSFSGARWLRGIYFDSF